MDEVKSGRYHVNRLDNIACHAYIVSDDDQMIMVKEDVRNKIDWLKNLISEIRVEHGTGFIEGVNGKEIWHPAVTVVLPIVDKSLYRFLKDHFDLIAKENKLD